MLVTISADRLACGCMLTDMIHDPRDQKYGSFIITSMCKSVYSCVMLQAFISCSARRMWRQHV